MANEVPCRALRGESSHVMRSVDELQSLVMWGAPSLSDFSEYLAALRAGMTRAIFEKAEWTTEPTQALLRAEFFAREIAWCADWIRRIAGGELYSAWAQGAK